MDDPGTEAERWHHPYLKALIKSSRLTPQAWVRAKWRESLGDRPAVPVDPKFVADRVRVPLVYDSTRRANAELRRTDRGRIEIVVGRTKGQRVRFSIAHELTHYLLLQAFRTLPRVSSPASNTRAHREIESLCNYGAAELLVPQHLLGGQPTIENLSADTIRWVSSTFHVSPEIAAKRLTVARESLLLLSWRRSESGGGVSLAVADSFPKAPIGDLPRVWRNLTIKESRVVPNVVEECIRERQEFVVPVSYNGLGELTGRFTTRAIPWKGGLFDPRQIDALASLRESDWRTVALTYIDLAAPAKLEERTTEQQLMLPL